MRLESIPGGCEGEALPDGQYAVLVRGSHIETHAGRVELPAEETAAHGLGPLYLRLSPDGAQMAGQSHGAFPPCTWRRQAGLWQRDPRVANGVDGFIFDAGGDLQVILPGPGVTSQGYRYVEDGTGRLVTGDETHADNARQIGDYTTHGDVTIGASGYDCVALSGGKRYRLLAGAAPDGLSEIRFNRTGDRCAVTAWRHGVEAVLLWFDVGELPTFTAHVVPVEAPVIPPIGRRLWAGWFIGRPGADAAGWETTTDPRTLPGSCVLVIPDGTVIAMARGDVVAGYAQGASDSDSVSIETAIVNARKAHPGVPIVAYWPRQAWAQVPSSEWVGVEAYRLRDESVEAFESRIRGAVARVARAVVIAQCYSSNANNTDDLASIPPVVARIARECGNVIGVLGFNGTGRRTGLMDHPEVRPLWEQVYGTIPGPPALPGPPVPPPQTGRFRRAVRKKGSHMRVHLRLKDKYIGIAPSPVAGKAGDEAFPVYADRPKGEGWETAELTARGTDGTYEARYVDSNRQLTMTNDGRLESRQGGAVGAWETFYATDQPDGTSLLYRTLDGRLVGPALTIEAA